MDSAANLLAFGIQGWEWIIILIIALLLFGSKLPSIMRGLGSSVKEFKKGMDEGDAKPAAPAAAPPAPPAPAGTQAREAAPVESAEKPKA